MGTEAVVLPKRFGSLERSDIGLLVFSSLVLLYCVYCAYLSVVEVNLRFILDPRDWTVLTIDRTCVDDNPSCLKVGDQVLLMGSLDLPTFLSQPLTSLYRDWEDAPEVPQPVVFLRDGQRMRVDLLPHSKIRWGSRKYLVWIFPLMFWVAGTIAVIFLRPRDGRWLVLVLLCYDTALWGASGFVSGAHAGISAVVFYIAIWLFLPLLFHLHLILPSRKFLWAERFLLIPSYVLAAGTIVVGMFVQVSRVFILSSVGFGILLTFVFLLLRTRLPDTANNKIVNRILLFGVGLGLAPIIFLALVTSWGGSAHSGIDSVYDTLMGFLFLLILPLWPFSYLYALYKHGIGKAEFRANRLLSSYGFLSAYVTAFVLAYFIIGRWFLGQKEQLIFSLSLSMLFVVLAPFTQRYFKLAVDKIIYGIRYQPDEVISLFAARIPAAFNRSVLARVILDEILPTMLVRQSALYFDEEEKGVDVVYEQDVAGPSPSVEEIRALRSRVKPFRNLNLSSHTQFSWVRLVIPLDIQDRRVGLWLFGRRDPDDYYPKSDVELLVNLGNQVAPVLENVRLVELAREEVEENRRLQEQLVQSQKMEAIGRLSAGVAHDFNNLLSVILGYSSLLLAKYRDDEALAKYLGDIKDAGNRAASLTKQLLAFSRQQVMEARVMDLNTVIVDLEKMLRRLTGEDVDLQTHLEEGLPKVKIDPAQMGQVIMNLAVNARDAMPEGGKLEITTRHEHLPLPLSDPRQGEIPAGSYALMTVTDSGTGVDPTVVSRIFEPYFTTKEMGKGTGLGLSMVYGIINQSKGYIRVESNMGMGTVFRIYLPESEEEVVEREEIPRRATTNRGSETILVVEDEDSVRQVACEILESNGYQVLQASNGVEALKDFEDHSGPIDLLLTDVIMPQMRGPVLAKELSLSRPDIKVMYMSGYNEESFLGNRLGKQGLALIQKPFSPQGLARRVREVLDGP